MKNCLNCGVATENTTGICTYCTEKLPSKKYSSLELSLLTYWKSLGVKWLYKYKHRVKEYRGENLVNIELFTDMTSGGLFQDIEDIAYYPDATGEEVKVDIDQLITERQNSPEHNAAESVSKESSMIASLVKQVEQTNAGEGHLAMGGIYNKPNLTAVVSVYDGQNPAHSILDHLYKWAEKNKQDEVVQMIEQLTNSKLD